MNYLKYVASLDSRSSGMITIASRAVALGELMRMFLVFLLGGSYLTRKRRLAEIRKELDRSRWMDWAKLQPGGTGAAWPTVLAGRVASNPAWAASLVGVAALPFAITLVLERDDLAGIGKYVFTVSVAIAVNLTVGTVAAIEVAGMIFSTKVTESRAYRFPLGCVYVGGVVLLLGLLHYQQNASPHSLAARVTMLMWVVWLIWAALWFWCVPVEDQREEQRLLLLVKWVFFAVSTLAFGIVAALSTRAAIKELLPS